MIINDNRIGMCVGITKETVTNEFQEFRGLGYYPNDWSLHLFDGKLWNNNNEEFLSKDFEEFRRPNAIVKLQID